MIAGREAERRLTAAEDCQKNLSTIIDEKEQSLAEAQTSLEMAVQQGRLLHDQNEKHEAQIMQLQQRVSILTQEVQSSSAGTAQSLDAFNQKEGLINQLSERIMQLKANTSPSKHQYLTLSLNLSKANRQLHQT